MTRRPSLARQLGFASALSSLAVLAGCNLAPRYHVPTASIPVAPSYKEINPPPAAPSAITTPAPGATTTPTAATTAAPIPTAMPAPQAAPDGSTWRPAQPSDALLRGNWWEVFGDPELNALEAQLEINNQNIKQYFENFLAARALIREARSQFYPTASIGPSFDRSRSSNNLVNTFGNSGASTGSGTGTGTGGGTGGGTGSGGGGTGTATGGNSTEGGRQSTLWSAPLDISWEPDLWGRILNTVRSDEYQAQVSAADLENERLTEEATLAQTFFELRGEDALTQVLDRVVQDDRRSYDLTVAQKDTGVADEIAVQQALTALRSAEAAEVNVGVARSTYEHAIATLIGKPATDFSMPVRPLLTAPPALPVGVPSQLLERRPDVAAAERTVASANALIGVGRAAYFPTLTLSAEGGFESSTFKHWFDWPSRFWSAGPSFSETVFDAGLRRATIEQYVATYNSDVASYRQTVLTAFQQVEDYLSEVRILSDQIVKQRQATDAAQQYFDLEDGRYRLGLDPFLNVLQAETTLLSDQQSLVTLEIQQMTYAVSLVEALGGGWDRNDLPTAKQVAARPAPADRVQTP